MSRNPSAMPQAPKLQRCVVDVSQRSKAGERLVPYLIDVFHIVGVHCRCEVHQSHIHLHRIRSWHCGLRGHAHPVDVSRCMLTNDMLLPLPVFELFQCPNAYIRPMMGPGALEPASLRSALPYVCHRDTQQHHATRATHAGPNKEVA